jgi:predicted nucleic acid-binding protein
MMRLFIDTNILIDLLIKREPTYESVARLFDTALLRKDKLVISNLSIVNSHYIVKKLTGVTEQSLRTALYNICTTCEIVPFTPNITMKALVSPFNDFEDAIQYYCALENNCDVIITNNAKDFNLSSLPVMKADEFIIANSLKND